MAEATSSGLPPGGRAERLERNLRALDRVDPGLAERVRYGVGSDHVGLDASGAPCLRWRGTERPLELDAPERSGARGAAVHFGLGLGDALAAGLREGHAARVVAWERDPWLLRCALAREDFAAPLATGALRLLLGADVGELRELAGAAWFVHPVLAERYADERDLVSGDADRPNVLLVTGELFVDQVSSALDTLGFGRFRVDVERTDPLEIEHAVRTLAPACLFSVNYREGTAQFCAALGLPGITWEIDPAMAPPRPAGESARDYVLATHRRALVPQWHAAGFARAAYSALAADPVARAPVELTEPERARFGAPVSFVGASMGERGLEFAREFRALFAATRGGTADAEREAGVLWRELLAEQARRPTEYVLEELLEERAPGLRRTILASGAPRDPALLVAEVAAANKRMQYVAALAPLGVAVWGDDGWRALEDPDLDYRGPAGHTHELNRVYCASTVNVDIGRLYQNDVATMRVFDALACGGFVLAEHNAALEEAFAIGEELVTYRDRDELVQLARHWVDHPAEARRIGARGREAVVERHRIVDRVAGLLRAAGVASPESP